MQGIAANLASTLLSFAIVLACGSAESNLAESQSLFGPFASYQHPSDVAELLRQMDLDWSVVEDESLSEDDLRPEFSILRWRVEAYRDGDVSGELHLIFFNERLAEVVWYPSESLLPSEREESNVLGRVRIRFDRDYGGRDYVSYADETLKMEQEAWLSKHS